MKRKERKERDDAPWWNPFAPRTLWCPETLGEHHVCDSPDVHWQHTCVCGFRWAA